MEQVCNSTAFNEDEWINLIFQLRDTQVWLNRAVRGSILRVPMKERKKLLRNNYYISVTALAHIIERHYHKVPLFPHTSKFTIPIAALLTYLRDASLEQALPIPDSPNVQRVIDAGKIIGYEPNLMPATHITVITDRGGRIITAFPGNKLFNADL